MVSENGALQLTPETATALAGSRILVVMNDIDSGDLLGRLRSVPDAEFCPVRTVEEAVRCYESFSPDVVVAEFANRASMLADGFRALLGKPVLAISLNG
jgi:hypothetical protein